MSNFTAQQPVNNIFKTAPRKKFADMTSEEINYWDLLELQRTSSGFKPGWSIYRFFEKYNFIPDGKSLRHRNVNVCNGCKQDIQAKEKIFCVVSGLMSNSYNYTTHASVSVTGDENILCNTFIYHDKCWRDVAGDHFG